MRILVTGGAGFIGSNIVNKLVQKGHSMIVVDNLCKGKRDAVNKNSIFYEMDIQNDGLLDVFDKEKPRYVIHQAAQSDVIRAFQEPCLDAAVNILGTINVLECCRKTEVKKIIYASSAAIYGNPQYLGIDEAHPIHPISFYGISKYVSEQYIPVYYQLYGLRYTILRYANVYGNRQSPEGEGSVISIFLNKMLRKEPPVIFGTGLQTRDFVYVADVVMANDLSLYKGDNGIFNIGTGIEVNMNELILLLNQLMCTNIQGKKTQARKGEISRSYFENKTAESILGWYPQYTLNDGLNEMISHINILKEGEADHDGV